MHLLQHEKVLYANPQDKVKEHTQYTICVSCAEQYDFQSIGIGRNPYFHIGTFNKLSFNVNETTNNSANATLRGETNMQLRDSHRRMEL